jgi:type VI secretion system Hcp family effector
MAREKTSGCQFPRFQYSVESPLDSATGQSSGKRQHKPIVITKEWGAASPQIFQALTTNEILSSVDFEFTKNSTGEKEVVYQRITLTNAQITRVNSYVGAALSGGHHGKKNEVVTLEYEQQLIIGSGAALPLPGEVKWFGK